jgi:hypothetical protein
MHPVTQSTFVKVSNTFFVDGGLSIIGQESIARDLLGLKHNK